MNLLLKSEATFMIRITGGAFRSRLIKTPNSDRTKPTMDKVRSAVFSSISDSTINADVLDLFAGSGSYGIEALSRGARSATFVDKGLIQIKTIIDNLKTLKIEGKVIKSDAFLFLRDCKDMFDIIFIDPPYKEIDYNLLLDAVYMANILKENGIIVLESEDDLSFNNKKINNIKKYRYGLAKIYILR